MQEYPQFSEPGMNNGILYGEDEYIETQSYSIYNKRDALKALAKQKGHLIASEDAATREIEQMDQAAEDIQGGLIDLGEYHYTVAVFGPTMRPWRSPWRNYAPCFKMDPASKCLRSM